MMGPAESFSSESPPLDETQLAVRLKADDDQAYEQAVRTFGPRMLAVARRLLTQEQDAQDAVQEAFLSAFRSIRNFQGDSSVGTWLHRIVVNAALMKLRSRKRRPETAIDDLLPVYNDDGHRRTAAQPAVLDAAVQTHEVREQVHRAIEQLPESYREILILRDIEELDTEETARQLEISEGAVKTRLHRARIALREILEPYVRGDST